MNIGLVDDVCTADNLLAIAEKKIRVYMKLNPVTWSQSKLNLRKELLGKIKADHSNTLNNMIDQWWSPATRQGLEMMIQNLKAKKTV